MASRHETAGGDLIDAGADRLGERGAVWVLVAEVVDAVEADLDVLVAGVEDRVVARMQAANGAPSPALREALRRGVSAAVREEITRLHSQSEFPQQLPSELAELARLYAESRWKPAALADAWLAGEGAFWDRFEVVAERTLGDTALCWEVIKAARTRLTDAQARLSEPFFRACEREFTRAARMDEGSRLRVVMRALDGHWVDPGELGYDLAGHHVAVIAETPRWLDAMARQSELQLLRVQAPGGGIWAWLGGRSRMSDHDLDALVASHATSNTRVAFGEPAQGIAGFAASHRQALEASAVVTNERAVRFADVRIMIAVLRDGDLANAFIERELRDLDGPGERMRELRDTLRVYLEHSQSVSSTAALRQRDRKTIERQLRSAEELIHHRVSERSDEVLVALRVAEILRHRD